MHLLCCRWIAWSRWPPSVFCEIVLFEANAFYMMLPCARERCQLQRDFVLR